MIKTLWHLIYLYNKKILSFEVTKHQDFSCESSEHLVIQSLEEYQNVKDCVKLTARSVTIRNIELDLFEWNITNIYTNSYGYSLVINGEAIRTLKMNQLITIKSILIEKAPNLQHAEFKKLKDTKHNLYIGFGNEVLKNLVFESLEYVGGDLVIFNNPNLSDLIFDNLNYIGGKLDIDSNKSLETIQFNQLKHIENKLTILRVFEKLKVIKFPKLKNDNIYISEELKNCYININCKKNSKVYYFKEKNFKLGLCDSKFRYENTEYCLTDIEIDCKEFDCRGDFTINNNHELEIINHCKNYYGNIFVQDFSESLIKMDHLNSISGSLKIFNTVNLNNSDFNNLQSIDGSLFIKNTTISKFDLPFIHFIGDISFVNNSYINEINFPKLEIVKNSINIDSNLELNKVVFNNTKHIALDLEIINNPKLTEIQFNYLTDIKGIFKLENNTNIENAFFNNLQYIGKNLIIDKLPNIKQIDFNCYIKYKNETYVIHTMATQTSKEILKINNLKYIYVKSDATPDCINVNKNKCSGNLSIMNHYLLETVEDCIEFDGSLSFDNYQGNIIELKNLKKINNLNFTKNQNLTQINFINLRNVTGNLFLNYNIKLKSFDLKNLFEVNDLVVSNNCELDFYDLNSLFKIKGILKIENNLIIHQIGFRDLNSVEKDLIISDNGVNEIILNNLISTNSDVSIIRNINLSKLDAGNLKDTNSLEINISSNIKYLDLRSLKSIKESLNIDLEKVDEIYLNCDIFVKGIKYRKGVYKTFCKPIEEKNLELSIPKVPNPVDEHHLIEEYVPNINYPIKNIKKKESSFFDPENYIEINYFPSQYRDFFTTNEPNYNDQSLSLEEEN